MPRGLLGDYRSEVDSRFLSSQKSLTSRYLVHRILGMTEFVHRSAHFSIFSDSLRVFEFLLRWFTWSLRAALDED